MEVKRKSDLEHRVPVSKSEKDYPYAKSAKVFHTDQVFVYSERVEPGKKASAPHRHKKADEVAYVVKGELHAYEGNNEVILREGDSVLFMANSRENHHLENKSTEVAEFLIIKCSGIKDDVQY